MPTAPKLSVLRAFEPFLGFLTCNKVANVESPSNRSRNLAKIIILAILSMSYIGLLTIDLSYCYGLGFDLRVIAFPFAILINGTQLMLTYFSLWTNTEQVDHAIVTLTGMVNSRKFVLG